MTAACAFMQEAPRADHSRGYSPLNLVKRAALHWWYEQTGDSEGDRALEIGPHRISDRQHALVCRRLAARRFGDAQCLLIDRSMGLTGIDDGAACGSVKIGNRARAVDKLIAALDDDIGIGADHGQPAYAHLLDELVVILRRLDRVVGQAGADRVVRRFESCHRGVEAVEDRDITLRTDMKDAQPGTHRDKSMRHLARAHDPVISLAG